MRSYRATLVVTTYDADRAPQDVLLTAADAVRAGALAVEDTGIRLASGLPAVYVRFLTSSDEAAFAIAETMRDDVHAVATTGGLQVHRRDGSRWVVASRRIERADGDHRQVALPAPPPDTEDRVSSATRREPSGNDRSPSRGRTMISEASARRAPVQD